MKIITISREFGSGGRELGKRLADLLGCTYYDREILMNIAARQGMDAEYVEKKLESTTWQSVPVTFRHTFVGASAKTPQVQLLLEQRQVIAQLPKLGADFVIVGRNADVLLQAYHPLKLFVCADMSTKVRRCMERAQPEDPVLSKKAYEQTIRRIDKNRARTCELISGSDWGKRTNYHLTINTSEIEIKALAPAVAGFAECWFGRTQ